MYPYDILYILQLSYGRAVGAKKKVLTRSLMHGYMCVDMKRGRASIITSSNDLYETVFFLNDFQ